MQDGATVDTVTVANYSLAASDTLHLCHILFNREGRVSGCVGSNETKMVVAVLSSVVVKSNYIYNKRAPFLFILSVLPAWTVCLLVLL